MGIWACPVPGAPPEEPTSAMGVDAALQPSLDELRCGVEDPAACPFASDVDADVVGLCRGPDYDEDSYQIAFGLLSGLEGGESSA